MRRGIQHPLEDPQLIALRLQRALLVQQRLFVRIVRSEDRGVIARPLLDRCRPGLVFANMSDQPAELDTEGCQPIGDVDAWSDAWRAGEAPFYRLAAGSR